MRPGRAIRLSSTRESDPCASEVQFEQRDRIEVAKPCSPFATKPVGSGTSLRIGVLRVTRIAERCQGLECIEQRGWGAWCCLEVTPNANKVEALWNGMVGLHRDQTKQARVKGASRRFRLVIRSDFAKYRHLERVLSRGGALESCRNSEKKLAWIYIP